MIVHIFQGGMVPISEFPKRQCIVCGKTGLRIDTADLEGTAKKVWNDTRKHLDDAARQYVEIVTTGEPLTSADAIFEGIVGRKPTAEESRKMTERINEFLRNRKTDG